MLSREGQFDSSVTQP
nr:unnamed protein product [Callosobruchus chinensis]